MVGREDAFHPPPRASISRTLPARPGWKNRLVPLRDVEPFWSILPSFDARAFHAAHGPFLNSRMFEAAQLAQVGANLFHCIGNVIDILATADEKVVRHPD